MSGISKIFKDYLDALKTPTGMDTAEFEAKFGTVSGKPNTLSGTVGYFKYAAKQTPGAIGTGKENLQAGGKAYAINFINKYKAKK